MGILGQGFQKFIVLTDTHTDTTQPFSIMLDWDVTRRALCDNSTQ